MPEDRWDRGQGRVRRHPPPLASLLAIGASLVVLASYLVLVGHGRPTPAHQRPGTTRTYYIAADSVTWDYAPTGRNGVTGEPFDDVAGVFVTPGPDRIGSAYVKSLYREYTDSSFTTPKPRPAAWEHLGFLGPVVHAVVGDRVRIVFKNNLDRPASVHMHGLRYEKGSEGAPYDDGTTAQQKDDDAVPPGAVRTYQYAVPERAGPGPKDPSSVMWMYHSHVDEVGDTNSGLVGPVIVTEKGAARANGTPEDVDRELVAVFQVSDENASLDLDANLARLAEPPADPDDEEFAESNLMHNINGYVYGNQPLGSAPGEGMTVEAGQKVRWYLMAMGTEVDLHTPHWHGNTVVTGGMRMDVTALLPAEMIVADMVPDAPGIWLFHCHVNDHIRAGMMTRYQVLE